MSAENARLLMVMYSGGFVALFATFMLMHWNAWRQRAVLGLDTLAMYDARSSMRRHLISVAIGTLSMAMALLAARRLSGLCRPHLLPDGPCPRLLRLHLRTPPRAAGGLTMPASFWDAETRDDICRRVERLTPTSKAQWGKFNVTEMLAHLNDAMRMAIGELPVAPKNLPIRYFPLKQLVVYVLPFPKSAPTAPELLARCTRRAVRGRESGVSQDRRSARIEAGDRRMARASGLRRAHVSRVGRPEVSPRRPSPPAVRRVTSGDKSLRRSRPILARFLEP